ncbi:hypothetical protein [Pseudolactococcus piscium]
MKHKDKKYIGILEEYLDYSSLSTDVYYVLSNAIERLKDGRYKKEAAQAYIVEWIEKLQLNEYELTSTDQKLYGFVKTKENKGIINSIAYSIANACRLL